MTFDMHVADPHSPARLFRSRAHWPEEIDLHPMEEIGNGPLSKMVRIALSDPDDELWAYSIHVADAIFAGMAIAALAGLAKR